MTRATLELTIEKAIYGGAGLAHAPATDAARAGKTIFVPMALTGEVVEVELVAEKKQFANAKLLRVITPSPNRITPSCTHYGVCGGCDYQHASSEAQLAIKKNILGETLHRAGLQKLQPELPEITTHAADPWHYRNRIRLHTALLDGRLQLGYTRAQSNHIVPIVLSGIPECPISAPLLLRAALAIESLAYEDLHAFDTLSAAAEVELFCNADESALLITLTPQETHAASPQKTFPLENLRNALLQRLPQLQSIAWRTALATAGLDYTVNAEKYFVPHGAFFQANRHLLPELLSIATASSKGNTAWDLYAGVGLFARALAQKFSAVTAVESASASIAALRHNLTGTTAAIAVQHAETLDYLRRALQQKLAAPDLILLDPPRTGLGPEVCTALAALASQQITYVSCDPATLARDLAALLATGYRITELHLFDMFPQTSHIESLVVLQK